ncbi:P-II family nitrogen regulator [Nesterenkonia sp. NBAIMH1]|uniref:P-II family nitrogen regulator n=1 Tax=Nesterenkonia sp. NBAIMH1 TaxID=2600320 RepID=UPI0011B57F9E|nr:transcriptional regulator [Nesterenkonia sp. NBAIMH1]
MFVIIPDDREEKAISLVEEAGATGVTALSARGVGQKSRRTFFGARFVGAQTALIILVTEEKVEPILSCLEGVLFEDGDPHGISFVVPVEASSVPLLSPESD